MIARADPSRIIPVAPLPPWVFWCGVAVAGAVALVMVVGVAASRR